MCLWTGVTSRLFKNLELNITEVCVMNLTIMISVTAVCFRQTHNSKVFMYSLKSRPQCVMADCLLKPHSKLSQIVKNFCFTTGNNIILK